MGTTTNGALYVSDIRGVDIQGSTVMNIADSDTDGTVYGTTNIYYDASDADNAYLKGLDYHLVGAGNGMLIAYNKPTTPVATTPIPGAVWLLGSGLVGLIGLKRKCLG